MLPQVQVINVDTRKKTYANVREGGGVGMEIYAVDRKETRKLYSVKQN